MIMYNRTAIAVCLVENGVADELTKSVVEGRRVAFITKSLVFGEWSGPDRVLSFSRRTCDFVSILYPYLMKIAWGLF